MATGDEDDDEDDDAVEETVVVAVDEGLAVPQRLQSVLWGKLLLAHWGHFHVPSFVPDTDTAADDDDEDDAVTGSLYLTSLGSIVAGFLLYLTSLGSSEALGGFCRIGGR